MDILHLIKSICTHLLMFVMLIGHKTSSQNYEIHVLEQPPFNNFYIEKEMILAVSWRYLNHEFNNPSYDVCINKTNWNRIFNPNNLYSDCINIFDFKEILLGNNFDSIYNRWVFRIQDEFYDYDCQDIYDLKYFQNSLENKIEYANHEYQFPINSNNRYVLPVSNFMKQVKLNNLYSQLYFNEIYLFKCKISFQKNDSLHYSIWLPNLKLNSEDLKAKSDITFTKYEIGNTNQQNKIKNINISIYNIWQKKLRNEDIYIDDEKIQHSINVFYNKNDNYNKLKNAMIYSLHNQQILTNNIIYAVSNLKPFPIDSINSWLDNNPNISNKISKTTIDYINKLTTK